jgi:hypothetical protein
MLRADSRCMQAVVIINNRLKARQIFASGKSISKDYEKFIDTWECKIITQSHIVPTEPMMKVRGFIQRVLPTKSFSSKSSPCEGASGSGNQEFPRFKWNQQVKW